MNDYKFKVGELVLITRGSIVDKVLEISEMNEKTVYRLYDNKGLFFENELQTSTNDQLAYYLKTIVENWVDKTFNQITLETYEKCLDNMLFEHIEAISEDDINDQIELLEERIEQLEDRINKIAEITTSKNEDKSMILQEKIETQVEELETKIQELEDEKDTLQDNNYPMWNTIFELKWNWLELTSMAQYHGMGVINSNDYFNNAIFMSSCGHSFLSSYWIPLYLALHSIEAELYKNVNYEGC